MGELRGDKSVAFMTMQKKVCNIKGEVFLVGSDLMTTLDDFELPAGYDRETVEVELVDDPLRQVIEAEVYTFNTGDEEMFKLRGSKVEETGDFRQYIEKHFNDEEKSMMIVNKSGL